MEHLSGSIVEFVRANQAWAAPIVFLLAFGESLAFVSLILPSTVILVAIGGLLGASGIDFFPAWIAAGLGGTLGYAISYWIGYYFKDDIDKVWPFRTRPYMLKHGRDFFDRWGVLGVFLGHFFGPLRAVIPVIAGTLAMRQLPFQLANASSAFLWALGILAPSVIGGQWLFG
ncbi:MAG: DedA family protein [Hyphomicrobiaceae bacterium]